MVCEANGTRCTPGSHRQRSSFARLSMSHVAHLTTVHHPQDPRIFHRQCKTLRDAGYTVHLVAQRNASATVDGIRIHALPEVSGRAGRLKLQIPMYRIARSIPAAVYHIHDPELIPLAWLLKRTTGASVIYDMHEDYRGHGPVQGRLLRALERWAFRWVDHIFIAEASYAHILSASDSYSYLPNYYKPYAGSCREPFAQDARLRNMRLLYTGVIAEKRGLFTMIELARKARNHSLSAGMDWVGVCYIDAERQRAESRIHDDNLDAFIRRVGWSRFVSPERMNSYYQEAAVGLCLMQPHPNCVQSIPTKFYEYLHHGLPILCSDFPLWRSFIERHNCGAVVPPGDAETAADVLRRWRAEPSCYQSCAQAARQAASQFRWRCVEPVLQSVYKRVCCTNICS